MTYFARSLAAIRILAAEIARDLRGMQARRDRKKDGEDQAAMPSQSRITLPLWPDSIALKPAS
jgi:hypothetical protein